MNRHLKIIHIGSLIKQRTMELKLESSRICKFIKCTEEEIEHFFKCNSLNTEILLKWSKLLEYDFFRIYSQHLILYSPPGRTTTVSLNHNKTLLPQFRKNIYTIELIEFILEQIESGQMTKIKVMKEYGIPKTTLYKWIRKYKK